MSHPLATRGFRNTRKGTSEEKNIHRILCRNAVIPEGTTAARATIPFAASWVIQNESTSWSKSSMSGGMRCKTVPACSGHKDLLSSSMRIAAFSSKRWSEQWATAHIPEAQVYSARSDELFNPCSMPSIWTGHRTYRIPTGRKCSHANGYFLLRRCLNRNCSR